MKSFTDLNQAKKLAEILPLESADMCYINGKAHLGFLYEEYKESFFSDYYDTVEKLNTLSKGKDMITPIFNAIKEANNHE